MKTEKKYKTDLLDVPVGTKMYLVITNRKNTAIFVEEVTYEGYVSYSVQKDYYEPKMIAPVYWTEPEFNVKFKRAGKKTPVSFKCRWTECPGCNLGYTTDEHIEGGMDIGLKGLELSAYGFSGYDCLDAYFTTNKEKAAEYLRKNAPDLKNFVTNIDSTYEEELAKLEEKHQKEKAKLEARFKTYDNIFGKDEQETSV